MLDVRRTETADRQRGRETSNRVPIRCRICCSSRGSCSEVPAAARADHAEGCPPVPKRHGCCISPRGEEFLSAPGQTRVPDCWNHSRLNDRYNYHVLHHACRMPSSFPRSTSPQPSHSFKGIVSSQWRRQRHPSATSRRSSTR